MAAAGRRSYADGRRPADGLAQLFEALPYLRSDEPASGGRHSALHGEVVETTDCASDFVRHGVGPSNRVLSCDGPYIVD